MIRARLLFRIVCLLWITTAAAADSTNSEFLVRTWGNEDGLPHSTINSILQTQDGYLWIGTYVGLVRFDGIRFVQYSSSNVPDLEMDQIVYLFEDRERTLWIALRTGRLVAWKEGEAHVIRPDNADNAQVIAMAQQTNGVIWLQDGTGALGRLTTNGVELVFKPSRSPNRASLGLVVDADDQLWVGTGSGLRLWRDGQLISPDLGPLKDKPVASMARARDGAVWVYFDRRLWKVRAGKILEQIEVPKQSAGVAGLLEAADGRMWLGSGDGGIFCLASSHRDWTDIPKSEFRGVNRILYEDHEGNIWRGGFGGGLTCIRPGIFTRHELEGISFDKYARSVCSDPAGNVWAVLNDQILSHISAGTKQPLPWPATNTPLGIESLFIDHAGDLWIGTDGGHLYRLHNGTLVSELNLGAGVEAIYALFEDAEDNLWVGFMGGAGVGFMPKGDPARWRVIEGLAYPNVRSIAQTADGAMWFGTHYGGAFRWKDGQWTQLTMHDGLPSDYVRCIVTDPDGTVWLGTIHGLCRWRDGKCVAITSDQGLWNDSISQIIPDGRGILWISSFGGIFRVRQDDLNNYADGRSTTVQCVGYNRNDGLANVECPGGFQPAGTRTPDGRLWFPTVGGLVSLNPSHIRQNELPPPAWLESATIDGRQVPIKHATTVLKAGPGSRRLDFRFTAPSFVSPEKVLFRHKLAGLDTGWSPPDNQRTVSYNYLPPGHYTFQVAACNNDGIWNMNGQMLQLVVQPYVWQTWWFKVMTAFLLAGVVAWGVRRRERWRARLRFERLEREHAVEHERSRIAKDIHDDLGANLTQIVFLSQRVEGASHEPSEVKRWIRLIPAAASRTIQSLDEIVWAINPKHDSLESLANYLSRFAQEFLSLAEIRCLLDVPLVLPQVALSAEVRHNLVLAAREALQNAVTHAVATEVRLTLQLDAGGLSIAISDNGRGFEPALAPKARNGLSNMRKRMEDIGGTLELVARPGAGTIVRFRLPANRLQKAGIGK